MAGTDDSVSVYSAGGSPMACYKQVRTAGTVEVQQIALVAPGVDGSGNSIGVDVDKSKNALQVVIEKGSPNTSGPLTAAVAGLSSGTLTSSIPVTNAKTGTLQHAVFSSEAPTLWELQTLDNAAGVTTVARFLTNAYETFDFKPGSNAEIATVLSTGAATFQVVSNNLSQSSLVTANAYVTFYWTES